LVEESGGAAGADGGGLFNGSCSSDILGKLTVAAVIGRQRTVKALCCVNRESGKLRCWLETMDS
jgi:hypothetical protein